MGSCIDGSDEVWISLDEVLNVDNRIMTLTTQDRDIVDFRLWLKEHEVEHGLEVARTCG